MKNSNSSLENLRNSKRNLSKEEMDKIAGGEYTGTCGWTGKDAVTGEVVSGCNTSKGHAIEMADIFNGQWCCDSCPQTSYCG